MKTQTSLKMADNLSRQTLSILSKFIASRMGLHFPEPRWEDLKRGISSSACEFGFTNTEEFITWLMSSPLTQNHIEILASHLTVGETFFFREKESFCVLKEYILSEITYSRKNNERRLRIWSAGCSTGEEPYSIAILLSRVIMDLKDWNITILATDINTRALKKALEGIYTEWSFRGTPLWVKESCFKRTKDGRYELSPSIKRMVTFAYLNLAEDVYPSLINNSNAMDLIFCRNVIMYFSPEKSKKVIQGFYNSLAEGGRLLVSPAEASRYLNSKFAVINFPGTILYQKCQTEEPEKIADVKERINRWVHEGVDEDKSEINNLQISQLPDPVSLTNDSSFPVPHAPKNKEIENQKAVKDRQTPYEEAVIMYRQGHYKEAEEKLVTLFMNGQNTTQVVILLAKAYANQGRLDDALKWCEKAITADIINPASYYLHAAILEELGRLEEAVDALKRALFLDPNFTIAYFVLGNLMLKQKKFKVSMKYFKNALDLSSAYRSEEVLPESEGITAGRLSEIVASITHAYLV